MSNKKCVITKVEKICGRGKNYTVDDKKKLLRLVDEYKDTIENKQTDATTTVQKMKSWEDVTVKFNEGNENGNRSSKQLKELYKSLKKNARENLNNDRIQLFKTGGGTFTPKSTDLDSELQGMMKEQFEPDENPYDDSAVLYSQDAVVSQMDTEETVFADDPVTEANSDPSDERSPSRNTAPPRPDLETPVASTSFADSEPHERVPSSDALIKGPSSSWPGAHKGKSSATGEKRKSISHVADTIVERKHIKNLYDKAAHSEKIKILEEKAVLLDTGKEIKKIDLAMKITEKEHLEIVHKKKLEILNTDAEIKLEELEIKKMERKIKELEYKMKLREFKSDANN